MKRWLLVCMTVAVVFCGLVAPVWADDLLPPPWQRGGDRTTYQDWTFALSDNPIAPDVGIVNPYGIAEATVVNGNWEQYYDNHVGSWDLGSNSYIDVVIPNAPDHPEWTKLLWTQITWQGELPLVSVDGVLGQLFETDKLLNTNMYHSSWLITLPYNPPQEIMHITGITHLGEIVVDTKCVPEPSTLVLLAIGAFGVATFVWRRQS
jgi:hypothetical protein